MPPIALLRYPDFVYAAWSAAQNRPLHQQMLPLSATGGGRIRCPSEEGFILRAFSFDETRRGRPAVARQFTANKKRANTVRPYGTSSFAPYRSQQPLAVSHSLTIQLLLFRKNHARLACSVVNALMTAHCRYQLLRSADRGKPCPYGLLVYNVLRISNSPTCNKAPLSRGAFVI